MYHCRSRFSPPAGEDYEIQATSKLDGMRNKAGGHKVRVKSSY